MSEAPTASKSHLLASRTHELLTNDCKHDVQEADRGNHGGLRRGHHSERQVLVNLHQELGGDVQRPQEVQNEAQPHQVHIQSLIWPIPRVSYDLARNRWTSKAHPSDPRYEIPY